jgi:hypothetical protein
MGNRRFVFRAKTAVEQVVMIKVSAAGGYPVAQELVKLLADAVSQAAELTGVNVCLDACVDGKRFSSTTRGGGESFL